MQPTISIFTICFNNLNELKQTCHSVDQQSHHPVEHWIIDGSTNKEILDWLITNQQPAYRKWIHERDHGISDAFNKGIKQCNGNIIHLLNAGDLYYTSDVLETVVKIFNEDQSVQWVHGLYVQHRGGVDVVTGAPFNPSLLWKGMRTVAHPTMFIKQVLYKKYGMYDTSLHIAMDYDFLVRIRNEHFHFIAKPLVYFSPGGASNIQFKKGLAEVKSSYQKHLGSNIKLNLWQSRQQLLHAVMQTAVGKIFFKWKNRRKLVDR